MVFADRRVRLVESDLRDAMSVQRTIDGAALVIVAAGPFQGMPLSVLEGCLGSGIPYLDVADDRDFVRRAHELIGSQILAPGTVALVGCSVVPGLTTLLTRFAQASIPRIEQTRICISPGTRHPRGPGSFACLLTTLGQKFTAPSAGKEAPVLGWSEPRQVVFPHPMGRRTGYRVVDIADHFTQPEYFGTQTVEFRIASEFRTLNLMLSAVRRIRQAVPIPLSLLMAASQLLIRATAPLGTTAGGVVVEVTGYAGGELRREAWCVFTAERGERIPSLIPAIAAARILSGNLLGARLPSLTNWISQDELIHELTSRNISVALNPGTDDWTILAAR